MKKFRFYKDIKVTLWNREHFEIEAEDFEEAKKIMLLDDYDNVLESEMLYDTMELMSVLENNGDSTIEIYDEYNNIIWTNTDEI